MYVAICTYETCIASRVARFKNERNSALQLLCKELAQVTSAIKPGQECMIVFCFGKENDSSRRVILKLELELNNLNSILSRSAVTPVFPEVSIYVCFRDAFVRTRIGVRVCVCRCVCVLWMHLSLSLCRSKCARVCWCMSICMCRCRGCQEFVCVCVSEVVCGGMEAGVTHCT